MIKEHTPKCMRRKYTEESKTLNHYQKYDIFEIYRVPHYVTPDILYNLLNKEEQMQQMIKEQIEMLLVTVGQFKSLLIHLSPQHNHRHVTSDINSPEKRRLRQKDYHQFCVEDRFYRT